MKSLQQLISEKESELQNLEDSLGFGFPIVEQAKMVQISHLQLELEDLRQIEDPYQLDDNQQIVLDWLKEKYQEADGKVFLPFWELKNNSVLSWHREKQLYVAYRKMSCEQQFEVLAAFAQWGLEQEESSNGIN